MATRSHSQAYAKSLRNFRKLVATATPENIATAEQWYVDAADIADRVAGLLRRSFNGHPEATREHGAGVIAALSPRVPWARNCEIAIGYGITGNANALGNSVNKATAAAYNGLSVFNPKTGPKTEAFARAIAGDDTAVTIDVWMMRAAGYTTDSPGSKYAAIASAVTTVAKERGMSPRSCQALLWILARGNAL